MRKMARRAASRVEQIDASFRALRPGYDSADHAHAQTFRREGMLVQGFGTLAVLAGLAALAGVLMLELWPRKIRDTKPIWRRGACLAANYAPTVLLVACGVFLVSFLPVSARFRSVPGFDLLAAQRREAYGPDVGSHGNSTVCDGCELCSFCLDYLYDSPEHVALVCVGAWFLSDAAYCGEARLSSSLPNIRIVR